MDHSGPSNAHQGDVPEVSRVVVIGASAGGLEGLVSIAGALPRHLDAALFMVLHSSARGPGILPQIIERAGALPAQYASDGEPICRSRIYVAPPEMHMLLTPDAVRLSSGPKVNGFRPAVDPLFRSAADSFEDDAIGVVLSGGLSDGAAGLRAIKRAGGFAIVQDPNEASFQSMPASALEMGPVDFTLPAAEIGPTIANLVSRKQPALAVGEEATPGFLAQNGNPLSTFTCPDCHGVLWEVKGDPPQFRCRVGHSYSVSRLIELQDEGVERSLWAAIRAMEESGSLARRLAEDAERRNQAFAARHFLQRAREQERHAEVLRQLAEAAPAVRKATKIPSQKA